MARDGCTLGGTAVLSFEAELAPGALEATATPPHPSPLFLGVVDPALVGTSADLFATTLFATATAWASSWTSASAPPFRSLWWWRRGSSSCRSYSGVR